MKEQHKRSLRWDLVDKKGNALYVDLPYDTALYLLRFNEIREHRALRMEPTTIKRNSEPLKPV